MGKSDLRLAFYTLLAVLFGGTGLWVLYYYKDFVSVIGGFILVGLSIIAFNLVPKSHIFKEGK